MKALDIVLTAEELTRIEEEAPKGIAAGERYHEVAMRALDVGSRSRPGPSEAARSLYNPRRKGGSCLSSSSST